MCAKVKKIYGGLDKESLAQSRVFPMERWSKSRENVTGFEVQPARWLRTCAKAKKTYGGLDKESLAQSRVFPMERWSSQEKSV
ncbi:hypothetical protein Taro_044250 [Colocasia esculenta]|uniref:Uncharacterized protein n=1 Tax=Colocasia esculenta TaxID=4460 RepID=A0A843WTJ0_COLES|nr:hypothetical protein [Colocasia esculenta]